MERQSVEKKSLVRKGYDVLTSLQRTRRMLVGSLVLALLSGSAGAAVNFANSDHHETDATIESGDSAMKTIDLTLKEQHLTAAVLTGYNKTQSGDRHFGIDFTNITKDGVAVTIDGEKRVSMKETPAVATVDTSSKKVSIDIPDASVFESHIVPDLNTVDTDEISGKWTGFKKGTAEMGRDWENAPLIGEWNKKRAEAKDDQFDKFFRVASLEAIISASDNCNATQIMLAGQALKAAIIETYTPGIDLTSQAYPEYDIGLGDPSEWHMTIEGVDWDAVFNPDAASLDGDMGKVSAKILGKMGKVSNLDQQLADARAVFEDEEVKLIQDSSSGKCAVSPEVQEVVDAQKQQANDAEKLAASNQRGG